MKLLNFANVSPSGFLIPESFTCIPNVLHSHAEYRLPTAAGSRFGGGSGSRECVPTFSGKRRRNAYKPVSAYETRCCRDAAVHRKASNTQGRRFPIDGRVPQIFPE